MLLITIDKIIHKQGDKMKKLTLVVFNLLVLLFYSAALLASTPQTKISCKSVSGRAKITGFTFDENVDWICKAYIQKNIAQ